MKEPLTEELLEELLQAPDVTSFTDKNKISKITLPDYLAYLLDSKSLVRSEVIRNACLNETFGYQIFMGQRNPSRNKVLQIAFSMKLNLKETERLLRSAGVCPLYVKNRRDAIIIFCLHKGYSLQKVNEELYRFNEETIC